MKAADGTVSALRLLRQLAQLNRDDEKPLESREMVKAAILSASGSSTETLDGFAKVISDWLTEGVMGCSYNLDDYEQAAIEGLLA